MSVTSSADQELAGGPQDASSRSGRPGAAITDMCPLCGSAIAPDQDWCLRCGAAARTRVAATPRWQPPLALLLVLAAICLAVLAAALVKLAHGSGPAPPALTVTNAADAPAAPGAATTPGTASSPAGTATTPATTSTAGAAPGTTTSTGAATSPGTATTTPATPATSTGSGASPAR